MKQKPTLHQQANAFLFKKAKELRAKTTPAEDALWNILKNRDFLKLKFRQQHPVGKYIADFYCHELKLVIEVDGGYHFTKEQIEKDDLRNTDMLAHNLRILRLTNEDVLEDIDIALEKIHLMVLEIRG